MRRTILYLQALRVLSLLAVACMASPGMAHARQMHVTMSMPAAEAIINGRHAEYVVRFDGPVNHQVSRLTITQDGRIVQELRPRLDSAVDVLFAGGEVPPPGRYLLHWQAESADGEMSAGDIPFSVAP